MAYDTKLAEKIRDYLHIIPSLKIEEKKIFAGLAFMINGKMCINVSGNKLMCRYDPAMENKVMMKKGFEEMIMKGKVLKGYCYVLPEAFKLKKDLEYWLELCLAYNEIAKTTLKKRK